MKNPLLQKPSPTRPLRVYRGGGWDYDAGDARVSRRRGSFASFRYDFQGFRLFRTQKKG